MDESIEIHGQQASDWMDVCNIRLALPWSLPFIRPEWVQNKFARLNHAISWPMVAVEHGTTRVFDNQPAIGLYYKFGFEKEGLLRA
ncbi:MAG: hypothetical protein JXA42_08210 [Anaerolineales bacterium]|nr:hypothetical protein [Anaerolineales bacterium]